MATAKQIAWRKKFAALSRAGKLNRKRNPAGARSEVRSPTSTRTGTKTSTEADTQGNITVTGGAGRGATTTVTVRGQPKGKSTRKRSPTCAPKKNPTTEKARIERVRMSNPSRFTEYKVQVRNTARAVWQTVVTTRSEKESRATAKMLHAAYPNRAYRVIDNTSD